MKPSNLRARAEDFQSWVRSNSNPLVHSSVELRGTESLQLFVGCKSDRVRVVLQKGSKKLLLPNLPRIRILLRGPRMLGGAPEVFPSLTALVDPQGGVGTPADALRASNEVMRD